MSRSTGQVKPGPFKSLSKREEQMERCRKSESKVTKRLIKKGLARDIKFLKSEVNFVGRPGPIGFSVSSAQTGDFV